MSSRHWGALSSHWGVSSRLFLACFRGFWVLRGEGEYLRSGFMGFLKIAKILAISYNLYCAQFLFFLKFKIINVSKGKKRI